MHRSRGVFIIALLCSAFAPAAKAAPPPEHVDAYLLVIKAEQAEKAGQIAEAAGLYEQSAARFIDVTKAHPDWQPDLVRYRIANSENQAARLRALLQAVDQKNTPEAETKTPEPVKVPERAEDHSPATTEPAVTDTRDEEIRILEEGLQKLERENVELRNQLADAEEVTTGLHAKVSALGSASQQLSNQVASLMQDLVAKNAAIEQQAQAVAAGADISRENEAMKTRLASLEQQNADLKNASEQQAAALESLTEQRAVQLADIAQRDERIRQLESDAGAKNAELQSRVDAAGLRIVQLESEVSAAREEVQGLRSEAGQAQDDQNALIEMSDRVASLTNELETARAEAARLNQQFESAVKLNQEYDRARRELEAERNRLLVQLDEGSQSGKDGGAGSSGALRAKIEELTEANEQMRREVDGLNHTIDRIQQKNATAKLRAQNSALLEENGVVRAELIRLESRIKELEQQLDDKRGGGDQN